MPERPYGYPALPDSWAPGPATRHARPVALGERPRPRDDEPPTDPFGFPPLSVVPQPEDLPKPLPPVAEAAALAAAFAADFLSWDEDDPGRRGRALADHLARSAYDPALLGWTGRGRQRAEFALPGEVRPEGDDRVVVDVRVRVTPYRAVGERSTGDRVDEPTVEVPGTVAAAPAPTGRGWRDLASYWVRMSVPVTWDDGRLVVEAGDDVAALPGPAEPGVEDAGGAS